MKKDNRGTEVLKSMKSRGLSVVRLARELKCCRGAIYLVFSGRFSNSKIRDDLSGLMTGEELKKMGWQRKVDQPSGNVLKLIRQARNLYLMFEGLQARVSKLDGAGNADARPDSQTLNLLEEARKLRVNTLELERMIQKLEEPGTPENERSRKRASIQ